jgi:hypothetical protein
VLRFPLLLPLLLASIAACDLLLPPAADLVAPDHSDSPSGGQEASCVAACSAQAKNCSHHACARGCNFVLDRLVQHEQPTILACVAAAHPRCDDRVWARCGTRLGLYADGGPPAPAPPSTDEPDDEGP